MLKELLADPDVKKKFQITIEQFDYFMANSSIMQKQLLGKAATEGDIEAIRRLVRSVSKK